MRQQQALPLILEQQTEKQKLFFNKQLLLHANFALVSHTCVSLSLKATKVAI